MHAYAHVIEKLLQVDGASINDHNVNYLHRGNYKKLNNVHMFRKINLKI